MVSIGKKIADGLHVLVAFGGITKKNSILSERFSARTSSKSFQNYMGVSLNGGTFSPHFSTPKVDHFGSRKTHEFVGKTQHFRKHPYNCMGLHICV